MPRLTFASLLLLTSCSSPDAQDGGAAADVFVSFDCAPDDGPALSLRFYATAVPECTSSRDHRALSFYVFDGATSLFPIEAGDTVSSASASGSATACPGGEEPCRDAESWSLTFETFAEGTGASGTYSVTFDGGEAVSGRFDATWCDRGGICG